MRTGGRRSRAGGEGEGEARAGAGHEGGAASKAGIDAGADAGTEVDTGTEAGTEAGTGFTHRPSWPGRQPEQDRPCFTQEQLLHLPERLQRQHPTDTYGRTYAYRENTTRISCLTLMRSAIKLFQS